MRTVLGELPDLPHLPELPARGPGADMIGRTAALLVDLHVDVQPAGWRLTERAGRDERRARSYLARDLDALEECASGYQGWLKLAVAGPWTLAASVELPRGDKALADPGARRDLVGSLAEGVAAHVADVRRRVPGATVALQVDEPSLPAVLAGGVRTASGFAALPIIERPVAEQALRAVVKAAGVPVIGHCCAPRAPIGLLQAAGVAGVSLDAVAVSDRDDEQIGTAVEAGLPLVLGLVPSTDVSLPDPTASAEPARRLWRRLGFDPERLAAAVIVSPSCGLAGASPSYARAAMAHCREVARRLGSEE